jgi:uncharacterized protein (DUF1330 family)
MIAKGYQRYVAAFMPILSKYGGRLLAADEHPEVTEGQWDGDKVVLMAFPDREAFTAWVTSLSDPVEGCERLVR